ncbi:hypothetical protein ADICEAN_04255 [Cesiribacter andamanensis AMV16]|uniref:Uncharacterized protein n=1 Tax=Cesiribacter andamanensis AMV16 TaxID=1279009 RepID=M7NQ12_9BACT|nr:hypothetical protein ADICEAN_04256 [Cesiribacter andamanensis AMV16]EMR00627.1 hypothetical protein ADICEAN_04255 [Cesiribacter andamanensis AMV16]
MVQDQLCLGILQDSRPYRGSDDLVNALGDDAHGAVVFADGAEHAFHPFAHGIGKHGPGLVHVDILTVIREPAHLVQCQLGDQHGYQRVNARISLNAGHIKAYQRIV